METGKVEYAPDYEASPAFVCPECYGNHTYAEHDNLNAQHARLKDAIVGAAKALSEQVDCYCFEANFDIASAQAGCELLEAVDALIAFEREHKIGESK